jgi:hypothetical protein
LRYSNTALSDEIADHAILGMFREGIVNVQRIPDVVRQWDKPEFEECVDRRGIRTPLGG